MLELKISKLEEIVGNARVLDESNLDLTKVLPVDQEQITEQFAEGNRKVFIGFDGWLFYRVHRGT